MLLSISSGFREASASSQACPSSCPTVVEKAIAWKFASVPIMLDELAALENALPLLIVSGIGQGTIAVQIKLPRSISTK